MHTSVKVLLFTSKLLSNGEHPVMLRITKNRKSKYISIGFSCSKELWDFDNQLPKKKHPIYKEASIIIQKKKLEASKVILDLENDDKDLSAYEIKGKLRKTVSVKKSLFSYFDVVINRLEKAGQIKTAEVYKDTRRNIKHFVKLKDLQFSEVDVQFLSDLESYLKSAGKGGNTIYIYLRTLRSLINKAIKEGVCAEKHYPFKKFSLSKYSNIKTDKRAITKQDVQKIIKIPITKHPHLRDAYNMFLFSYYCRGMNFADIAFLRWTSIKRNRLSYSRQKTGELIEMELLKPALSIIKYYKEKQPASSPYVFPIFNDSHATAKAMYNRKVKMLRKVNESLKEIGKLAKLDTPLTTYVARHTFATVLKKQGINTAIISEMLGHESEKTTQIYLDSFGKEILDKASKALL